MAKEIQYTQLQTIFLAVLDILEIPRRAQVGLFLMLKDNEEQMKEWTIWLYDNHPTEQMIMDRLLERE